MQGKTTARIPLSNTSASASLIENPGSGNSPATQPPPQLPGQSGGRPGDERRPPLDRSDFGIRIARDGTWFYRGSPISRLPLVKLFASVLRREADGHYWLVTPAERGRIAVEDVPFLAVELEVAGEGREQRLIFRTNLDDIVTAGPDHPLRVMTTADGAPAPYILVRGRLEAKLARPVFYELVELGDEEQVAGETQFGVWSGGAFFRLGDPGPDWR